MKKKITIKDIANLAKVSSCTVSKVINKKYGHYSKKTEEKILAIIEKYNYSPNIIAKSLKTKMTKTIGIIVPDIINVYFAQVYKAMEESAKNRGYTTILGCSYYDIVREEKEINVMLDKLIDGIIFLGGFDEPNNVEKVNKLNIPLIIVDRFNDNNKYPSIVTEDSLGVEKSVDYLTKFNHKDINYISFSPTNHFTTKERINGFIKGLEKNNIDFHPKKLIIDESLRLDEVNGTYELIKRLYKEGKTMPTAFVLHADNFAIGLFKGLKELGFRIPQDISVIGFDNTLICKYLEPPLTTVYRHKKTLGMKAMDLILDTIEGKKVKNKNIILPTKIMERDSVGFAP